MIRQANVTEGIWRLAQTAPDQPAVLTRSGALTFAQLDRAVRWTAAGFAKAGLAPGDIVALQLPHQGQHLIAALALARLGVGQLALETGDPPRQQEDQVRRLDIAATVSARPEQVAPGTAHLAAPPARLADLAALPECEAPRAEDPDLPFMVLRSSGTTSGVVKLSLLSHRRCLARNPSHRVELPQGPGHRYLALVDLSFVSVKQRYFAGLEVGTCVVPFDGLSDIPDALPFFVESGIDYISGTPQHADQLLRAADELGLRIPDLAALRLGTTVIRDELRARILRDLTPNLYIGYGSNEIGPIATATPDEVARVPGAVGRPVAGVETRLLDRDGQDLPAGAGPGRLLLRSPGMITQYHDAPDESARAFRDGWFDSGDLVELTEEGVLVHHGRADDVMIFDGLNIYPAEIESVLLKHPAVAEAAAFPVLNRLRGNVPFAAAVTTADPKAGGPTHGELMTHCEAWLGKRAPRGLLILPQLPRNSVGKVLKRELSEMALQALRQRQGDGPA